MNDIEKEIKQYTQKEIEGMFLNTPYEVVGAYRNNKEPILCKSHEGYYYDIYVGSRYKKIRPISVYNPYSLHNLNVYLLRRFNGQFVCISTKYKGSSSELVFHCNNCKTDFTSTWNRINRLGETRSGLICPKCGGRNEQLHALVLKQIFLHEDDSTVVEDPSCRNQLTGKIIPTDIVCHKRKIAIEIQSEYHDTEYAHMKEQMKRNFWENLGYSFYVPDIRNYTIKEMVQLFFPEIKDIPTYVDFNYSNKLNIPLIQDMLSDGYGPHEISLKTGINCHRIYDAIYAGKLSYAEGYTPKFMRKVVQFDMNKIFVSVYKSLNEAERITGVKASNIEAVLSKGRSYSGGYFWVDYNKYVSGDYELKTRLKNVL